MTVANRRYQVSTLLAIAIMLAGCLPKRQVVRRDGTSLIEIQRVVVMPFTDDPLLPGSGLKAAAFLRTALQLQIPNVEWIGPLEILKRQGVDVSHVMDEDASSEEWATLQPLMVKLMEAAGIPPGVGKLLTPGLLDPLKNKLPAQAVLPSYQSLSSDSLAKQYEAQAILRGALSYDRGLDNSDHPEISVAAQLVDANSGAVLLALRPYPFKSRTNATLNESFQAATEFYADKLHRGWR